MRGFSPGKRHLAVARIERSEIRGRGFDKAPDFATLYGPGQPLDRSGLTFSGLHD